MENKKYWSFENKGNKTADLYLYNSITSWGSGEYSTSAKSFKKDLDNLGELNELNVYINSPGGDVFEGVTISNMLKRVKGDVNIHIDGIAASIASVIAMSGNNIIMPKNSMMMIHNAWSMHYGNAKDFRKMADDLDKITDSIKQTYLDKADNKIDYDTLTDLMDNETWLTAEECFNYGLCTEVSDSVDAVACVDEGIFKNYKNIPDHLKVTNEIDEDRLKLKENLLKDSDLINETYKKIFG